MLGPFARAFKSARSNEAAELDKSENGWLKTRKI